MRYIIVVRARDPGKGADPGVPPLQPVRRDFVFRVNAEVPAERTLIVGVSPFAVNQWDKLPEGKKSLAIEMVFQPRERSLTDAEIEAATAKAVAAVAKATEAPQR